ncbi:MAG TPA: SUMF1/EgtB/PvdO family nonheme iron enzyme [Pyrinomonadaceae bacterium]|nr:SUMF1/EgtB/PvdO family nonheme iron enzyme [Pyrinomonadaceae bacterium]
MKKVYSLGGVAITIVAATVSLLVIRANEKRERAHYERDETPLLISGEPAGSFTLFRAGKSLPDAVEVQRPAGETNWLKPGNYFLKAEQGGRSFFFPIPIIGYRRGPDKEGSFVLTVRLPASLNSPPRLTTDSPEFIFIPSGHFLFGDRLRVQEPHYVWLSGFFLSVFEVTNGEFKRFMNDPHGYADDANWTAAGRQWRAKNQSLATARLAPGDPDFQRFGQPDQPVVQVNWFEANAFRRWLTGKLGDGKWIFTLPTEAEWEKAARGPDNFDYGLGASISDNEVPLYNWRKNPAAETTVVGLGETRANYLPNRYGLYHMSGNVAEWTESVYRPYGRQHPYINDDDRNEEETPGQRVLRGGSWYTATIAVLYIPYRENFPASVQTPYLGFRLAARPVP